jgi:hypothetical protein
MCTFCADEDNDNGKKRYYEQLICCECHEGMPDWWYSCKEIWSCTYTCKHCYDDVVFCQSCYFKHKKSADHTKALMESKKEKEKQIKLLKRVREEINKHEKTEKEDKKTINLVLHIDNNEDDCDEERPKKRAKIMSPLKEKKT